MNHTIIYYSWPYLQPIFTNEIPHTGLTRQVSSEQVHVCKDNSVYVFSTYTIPVGTSLTGVAYMTVPSSSEKIASQRVNKL